MILPLVPATDPILREPCEPFIFGAGVNAQELVENMIETMETMKGLGLAANQVGVPYRVFVTLGEPFCCFNPRIVDTSDGFKLLEEGCLTYPGLHVKIKRPTAIRIRYQDYTGETHTKKFIGMTARVIQHEMDHLDGVIFYNKASRYHRDAAMRKWRGK